MTLELEIKYNISFRLAFAEVINLITDRKGHFNNDYVTYQHANATIKPIASKHGLSYSQTECFIDGQFCIRMELRHDNGLEKIFISPMHPNKQDMAGFGAAMTYTARRQLLGVFGIVGDVDADAPDELEKQDTKISEIALKHMAEIDECTPDQAKEYYKNNVKDNPHYAKNESEKREVYKVVTRKLSGAK